MQGTLMGVEITPANCGEREGGKRVLQAVQKRLSWPNYSTSRAGPLPDLKSLVIYVDQGFDGIPFEEWAKEELGWEVRVVKKRASDGIAYCEDPNPTPKQFEKAVERSKKKGFVLLPKRWVIERTNGWMAAQRKLRVVVGYASHCIRGWNWLTMMDILIRRSSGQKLNLII
jgi:transposase